MGVYAISWALTRQVTETEEDETWEFQSMLQIVKNVFSRQEAAQCIADSFEETQQAQNGWELTGPPSVLLVSAEVLETWTPYVDPPPANQTKKPDYLRPVED